MFLVLSKNYAQRWWTWDGHISVSITVSRVLWSSVNRGYASNHGISHLNSLGLNSAGRQNYFKTKLALFGLWERCLWLAGEHIVWLAGCENAVCGLRVRTLPVAFGCTGVVWGLLGRMLPIACLLKNCLWFAYENAVCDLRGVKTLSVSCFWENFLWLAGCANVVWGLLVRMLPVACLCKRCLLFACENAVCGLQGVRTLSVVCLWERLLWLT